MTLATDRKTVGFIGLGIMGHSMAGHILAQGHDLRVFSRTRAKADDLLARGARWVDSPAALAAECDVVISIVGYPADVEQIYLSADGIVAHARRHAILIDMTTSSPGLARRIADAAAERGLTSLDAPVSGGEVGARDGTLAIMVGGDPVSFNAARPLFEAMGSKITHMGPAGAGQHTKMANQIAIASTMVAVCEALSYAKAAGLEQEKLLDAIGAGAASSFQLNVLGPKIAAGDFAPGFFVHHFVKDMSIALAEADRMKLNLPGLSLARGLYQKLIDGGFDEDGTQALYRVYSGMLGGGDAV
ncbi:NAD(P)-dependent oxidoreductase [Brevirhabdus sp.]|uniref:NAD(P)-dependent oxidoreductase n=1 Tax=Brevirhabdus sp. TaxID=2004514 RepID=UPI004059F360